MTRKSNLYLIAAQFKEMLQTLELEYHPVAVDAYTYDIEVPSLGRIRVSLDLKTSGPLKSGLWVMGQWEKDAIGRAVALYGNRYQHDHDFLFAENLNPHNGKFNFFDSYGNFTGFEAAISAALNRKEQA